MHDHPSPLFIKSPVKPSLSVVSPCCIQYYTLSPLSLLRLLISPVDDNLLSGLWIVFHEVEPLAKSGVAAVLGFLSTSEPTNLAGGISSMPPPATAGGAHTAAVRKQEGCVGIGGTQGNVVSRIGIMRLTRHGSG